MQPSDSALDDVERVAGLLKTPQYGLSHAEKSALLGAELCRLTQAHALSCPPYARILEALGDVKPMPGDLSSLPPLPVRLFKTMSLRSVGRDDIVKELTSSGTSSQQVSKVAVDRSTATLQTRALASIVTSFIGRQRIPMIIVDSQAVLANRASLSARAAGLLGLAQFGRDHFYALDENMRLKEGDLRAFASSHAGRPILVFGFTFMIWQYLLQPLKRAQARLNLSSAFLLHGGGWKKLQDQAVSNADFKSVLAEWCGIERVHSYYGMVEQVGSIHMECEHGFLHAPDMADVLIRDADSGGVQPPETIGLIQTLSALPRSYPGHSLLTDDLGVVHGIDDCPCGRLGTRFSVLGRAPKSELRGCSDTHAFSRSSRSTESAWPLTQFLPQSRHHASVDSFVNGIVKLPRVAPFDDGTFAFFDAFSKMLMSDSASRRFPEVTALAFWLRRANLTTIADRFMASLQQDEIAQPLGLAFHVAPSNVDTIFVYSWALSLLAGNNNIVRLSQARSAQLEALLAVLTDLAADPRWRDVWEGNALITYGHSDDVSSALSAIADVRILWGGDHSVAALRAFVTPPGSRDIAFVDKISCTVIEAERLLLADAPRLERAASDFVKDAYQFDQLACSSPHLVFFCGSAEVAERASTAFWSAVRRRLTSHDVAMTSNAADKNASAYELAASIPGARWVEHAALSRLSVVRIPVASVPSALQRVGGGFFVESFVRNMTDLEPIVSRRFQTLGYFGFSREEVASAARSLSRKGIDRLVPMGKALDFHPVWDGYHLLSELTRRVVIQ